MTKEEISKFPKMNFDGIKSVMQDFKNMQGAIATPKIDPYIFVKPEIKMMAEIAEDTEEIKKNSKPSPWFTIWTGVIGAVIGGVLVLLVEHFLL